MNTTYGIGGALSEIGGNLMQMGFMNMRDKKLDLRKKQADEAAKLLEEARVARTSKPYMKKASPWVAPEAKGYMSPDVTEDQVRVDEFNSQGRNIGSRLAAPSEVQGYQSEQEALQLARTTAEAKAKSLAEKDDLARRRSEASILRDTAAANLTNAKLANPGKYGPQGGKNKLPSSSELLKDINNILKDSDNQQAALAGDPSVLKEWGQKPDAVVEGMGAVARQFGIATPKTEDRSILAAIMKEQDPEVQAQMLLDYKMRLELAMARGRGAGKGVKAPRQTE